MLWGGLLSRERHKLAEAEAVSNVEGNMCGAATRGADALPWSKTPSRSKGSRRNLGGPAFDRWAHCPQGPHREGEEPKPMMHERGTSDPVIVALKPANKAERSAAESVERRAGAKGNADQQITSRTPSRTSVTQVLDCIPRAAHPQLVVTHPRWEPYAGKPHVRFCAGGAQK
jgi:hypothetical protein